MRLYVSFDYTPEYARPIAIRLTSDDRKIDRFAGVQDYTDIEQLKKLFESWISCTKEINMHENSTLKEVAEPLTKLKLPWMRKK